MKTSRENMILELTENCLYVSTYHQLEINCLQSFVGFELESMYQNHHLIYYGKLTDRELKASYKHYLKHGTVLSYEDESAIDECAHLEKRIAKLEAELAKKRKKR